MENEPVRKHHPYSPSTLQYREACPCYQPQQTETPHPRTVIGTIAHGVTETGEDDPRLSDDDTDLVVECIEFYEARKKILQDERAEAVRLVAANMAGEPADVTKRAEQSVPQILEIKESYLPVDDKVFEDATSTTAGYSDSSMIDHTETYAEMFDWKFGRWPVEKADNNLQGMSYALGLFKRYTKLQRVRFFFKQPVVGYITDHVFTRDSIDKIYLRIQVVVAKAREAKKKVAVGDFSMANPVVPACNFCALLGRCDKVAEFACKVGAKFHPLLIPADITPTKIHSEKDMVLGLRLAQVLSVWGPAYKKIIADRAITGEGPVPPDHRIASKTPREIKDHEKYKEVALRYLTSDEYATTLRPGFTAVEKLISDKAPRGEKGKTLEKFDEETRAVGAVVDGYGYSFLQAIPAK